MYDPVAFPSNHVQSSTSLPNSSARGTITTSSNTMTRNTSNTSGTITSTNTNTGPTQRRRSSGLNSFLNTFGIRQNNNANNSTTTNADTNTGSNNPFEQNDSVNRCPDLTSTHIQPPVQAHTRSLQQGQGQGFNHLPLSISLIAQNEPGAPQPAQLQHRASVSASTSPIGALAPISHAHTHPVPLNGPITDIDPLNSESSNLLNNNDTNSSSNSANANGANGATASATAPPSNLDNIASLKNLRHYIYAADQPNAEELLNLDLARNASLPEPADEETVEQRKDKNGLFSIRLTPFIDSSFSTSPGLAFDPVIRTAGPGSQLVIGRYTERVREAISKIPEQYHPVVFKSKVVSRTHGCFKVDSQGNWYIKDVRSSSGTFLNHQRLAPASTLSKDTLIHDGDVLQLGMDFRGGTEEIYRCVKIRVELNRSWKRRANAFNKEALQRIRNLQKLTMGLEEEDCSICLSKIKPCQAMFISPCSHCWHFQCIRRLLMTSYPQFVCPNCRSTCDLEASLENSDSETESENESDGDQLVDELGVLLEDPKDTNMG